MIFVFLSDVDLNVEPVAVRVEKGGHSVPEAKIRSRWVKSFEQFAWFLREADHVDVFENSGAEPKLVLSKVGDVLTIADKLIPELQNAVLTAFPTLTPIDDWDLRPVKGSTDY